jgi:hypothetical protein
MDAEEKSEHGNFIAHEKVFESDIDFGVGQINETTTA